MTRTIAATILVALALTSLRAAAAPAVFYKPATGGVWFKNDLGTSPAIYVGSVAEPWAVMTTNLTLYTLIPGTIFDSGDLPLGITYFDFPVTKGDLGIFIGNVISPGTPVSGLQAGYYHSGVLPTFPISMTVIPEPNAAIITVIALVGLSAIRQRPRRDR